MNRHFTQDEMIGMLYGTVEKNKHLDTCVECSRRWREMQAIRGSVTESVDLSARELAGQRQRIWERIEEPAPARIWRWAPAVAMGFLIAMGVFLLRPNPPLPPMSLESDSQLFTDVYAMEQTVEPRAAAPIRALFEEEQ